MSNSIPSDSALVNHIEQDKEGGAKTSKGLRIMFLSNAPWTSRRRVMDSNHAFFYRDLPI